MQVKIHSSFLNTKEKSFIKEALTFNIKYLFRKNHKLLDNLNIKLEINPKDSTGIFDQDEADCKGLCFKLTKTRFLVWITNKLINPRAKSIYSKFKEILSYMFHELVHVHQYRTGTLKDNNKSPEYRFNGKKFKIRENEDEYEDEYYTRPEEIDAYGREVGLRVRFENYWNEVLKYNYVTA